MWMPRALFWLDSCRVIGSLISPASTRRRRGALLDVQGRNEGQVEAPETLTQGINRPLELEQGLRK